MIKKQVKNHYQPQPKQQLLHQCPANEILFGGSAGPGKSYSIRHEALTWGLRVPGLQIYLFRRTYPELEKNHILPILNEWGERYGKYNQQQRRYNMFSGSCIHMCHAQYDKDVMMYHGAEIHLLVIDELSTFSEWQYVYLRNRVRCTLRIKSRYKHRIPGIICASNPGGPGHEFAKRLFVDYCRIKYDEAYKRDGLLEYGPIYIHPSKREGSDIYYGVRRAAAKDGGMLRAYIPALLEDNAILMERDPGYRNRVEAMPEPFRSAYLEGDWEMFVGQAFGFNRKHHVCAPFPIPQYAPLYFTFDWGFAKPYSCGWWFTDNDGRIYRFGELYGWNGTPDTGLRHTDSEIVERVIAKEIDLGLRSESGQWQMGHIVRLCDPTCFNKKPNYLGGGQGTPTSEVFSKAGLIMQPGDPSRVLKIRQFHERLRVPKDDSAPMMMIFDTCEHFIRTIPLMQIDIKKPEDIDTTLEDHIYDEAAHICMARPLSRTVPRKPLNEVDKRILQLQQPIEDEFERYYTERQKEYGDNFYDL